MNIQSYRTIRDNSSKSGFILEPIVKPYITACNGYTVFIYKRGNTWEITESITGFSFGRDYKTLKEARKHVNDVSPEVVTDYIGRNVKWLLSTGLDLPNYQAI